MKTFIGFIKDGYSFPFVAKDMNDAIKKMKNAKCEVERIEEDNDNWSKR